MPRRLPAPGRTLVHELLRSLGAPRPRVPALLAEVRRWDDLIAFAAAHAVGESLWAALSLRGLAGAVPEGPRQALQAAHAGAVARNTLLLAEAAALQAALRAAGIESLLLKGPGMLLCHYPSVGARHVGDIDVLVRAADCARAAEVAQQALGARPLTHVPDFEGRFIPADTAHHLASLESAHGLMIELHRLLPGGHPQGADLEGVLARARTVRWQGRELRVPSAADLLASVSLHVTEHHAGDPLYLPRHVADLALLVDAGATTWEAAAATCAPRGAASLAVSRLLLERPEDRGGDLAAQLRSRRLGRWHRRLARLWRESPAAAWRVFFPSRAFMGLRYGVSERSPWLPLLYLWRPVRGAFRALAGR